MKQKLFALLLCVLCLTVIAEAQTYVKHVKLTIAGTASGFTASDINGDGHPQATSAVCQLTGASGAITYRVDGTATTSTTGQEVAAGSVIVITGTNNLLAASFIRTTSTSGDVRCVLSGQ